MAKQTNPLIPELELARKFVWQRDQDGYEIVRGRAIKLMCRERGAPAPAVSDNDEFILECSGSQETYCVRQQEADRERLLYADLVCQSTRNDDAVAFTTRWGWLICRDQLDCLPGEDRRYAPLSEVFFQRRNQIAAVVTAQSAGDVSKVNRVINRYLKSREAQLVLTHFDVDDECETALTICEPANLISCAWCQLMWFQPDPQVRKCPGCDAFFPLEKGQRRTRRYCGNRCRQQAHRNRAAQKAESL